MADVSVPNNLVDGATVEADEHNANFAALVNWMNTEAVRADGSIAFSALPSLPAADPTTANQPTRKSYVDNRAGGVVQMKTKNTSSSYETFAAGGSANTWYPMSATLKITVAEVTDHWYKSTLIVPALACTENAEASNDINRIAAGVLRDGTEISRHWVVHDVALKGMTAVAIGFHKATADASVVYAPNGRHGRSDLTGLAYSSGGSSYITHIVEDIGLDL